MGIPLYLLIRLQLATSLVAVFAASCAMVFVFFILFIALSPFLIHLNS
jgi:hypothetical protein